jgi:DNA-binding transcriptional MocR family regulator
MAELHLDREPEPPVAAFDAAGETVLSVGSMSKGFWAGLRIGWVRAAPATVGRLVAARAAFDLAGPVIEQLVAAELLAHAGDVLATRREQLRARRAALAAALPPGWRAPRPAGGLSLWVELDAPRSTALAAVADRHGVRVAAGPRFGVDGAFERFVRLPYTLPEPILEEAAARLRLAWRAVAEGAAAPPHALVA